MKQMGKTIGIVFGLLLLAVFVVPAGATTLELAENVGVQVGDTWSYVTAQGSYEAHDPIEIRSNIHFETQGWPGNGTIENPYMIEGLEITTNSTYCIEIWGTTDFFIIRNCRFNSAYYGTVAFTNVQGGTIENCIISATQSGAKGIQISESSDCSVVNNTLNYYHQSFSYFLTVRYSANCLLYGNVFNPYSGYTSMHLYYSEDCRIENHNGVGLVLHTSTACIVVNNNFKSTFSIADGADISCWLHDIAGNMVDGVPIWYFKNTPNIEIKPNDFYGQLWFVNCSDAVIRGGDIVLDSDKWIFAAHCDRMIVSDNAISNVHNAILLKDSSYSMIRNNTFTNCSGAILTSGTNDNITENVITNIRSTGIGCGSNAHVAQNIIRNAGMGLRIGGDNCIIKDNTMANVTWGIQLDGSYNLVMNNTVERFGGEWGEGRYGILTFGHYNEISNNTIVGNVRLEGKNCIVNDNNLEGYLLFTGTDYEYWDHSMSGNMVNGKPLLFLKGSEKKVLDKVVDYGQIILLNCSDMVIKDTVLSVPMMVGYSTGVTVSNNTITDAEFGLILVGIENSYIRDNVIIGYEYNLTFGGYYLEWGIRLVNSNNSVVENNLMMNGYYGITTTGSQQIIIKFNEIRNCVMGIELGDVTYSNITQNTIADCSSWGLYIWSFDYPLTTINVTGNDFINNFLSAGEFNYPSVVPLANYECNYWSDYEGEDLDDDGFGDTAYDVEGNTEAVDNRPRMFPLPENPPVIVAPEDLTYSEGDVGNYIYWSAIDFNTSSYSVYFEGELLYAGLWNSSSEILSINVDGLTLGIYNYTIIFEDGMGYSSTDTVYVEVVDGTPPVLTHPNDLTYSDGSTGHTISWQGTENYPSRYELFKNGFIHWFGPWNSSSEMISVGVDGLGVGVHNFTIIVYDTSGNSNHDSVFVTVVAGTTTTTPTTTTDTTPTTTTTGDPTTDGADISIALVAVGGTLLAIVVIVVLSERKTH